MRIVVAHSRLNALGGGERVTLELLRRLGRRHEVTLWASDFHGDATYRELADYPRRDLATWQWPLLRPQADAVIAQSLGAWCSSLRHPSTLCYVHTLRSRYLELSYRPGLVARRTLDRAILRRASAVVAPSSFVASIVSARIRRPVDVVLGGVDDDLFQLSTVLGTYALFVGRLAPEKGLDRLLAWMMSLDIDLHIVGTGSAAYVDALRARAGPRVRWLGALEGAALRQAYQGCRLLVFTPYREEFGLAALEAMAAGKPVVAIADGGLPELVRSGETGYLISDRTEMEHAVATLRENDDLCRRMGYAARKRARGYSWDTMASGIEFICERMVSAQEPSAQRSQARQR